MFRKKTIENISTTPDIGTTLQDQLTTMPDHIVKQIMSYREDDILNLILINKKLLNMGIEHFVLAIVEKTVLRDNEKYFDKEEAKLIAATRFTDWSSDGYLKQKIETFVTAFRRMTIASAIVLNLLGLILNKAINEPDPHLALKLTAGALIFSLFYAMVYSDVVISFEAGKKMANRKKKVQDHIAKIKAGKINLIDRKKNKLTLFASKPLPANTSSSLTAKIKKNM